jgi:hypothetical protein
VVILPASIFANEKILIGIICGNALCNHPHSSRDLLIGVESESTGHISLASKILTVRLASFYNLHKQLSPHLIPSTEEGWRVCEYLDEIILHQSGAAEGAVPWDANTAED